MRADTIRRIIRWHEQGLNATEIQRMLPFVTVAHIQAVIDREPIIDPDARRNRT